MTHPSYRQRVTRARPEPAVSDTLGGPDGTVWTGLAIFGFACVAIAIAIAICITAAIAFVWAVTQIAAPVMPS